MHQLEFSSDLIDGHRTYLRSLYHPLPSQLPARPSRREALGGLLVRAGHWLQRHRPEAAGAIGNQAGSVQARA